MKTLSKIHLTYEFGKVFMIEQLKIILFQTLNPQITHWCEAPRSMLSNYFNKKQVFRGTFGEIWRIQIQIYPQTSIEPRYGAF